MELHVTVIIYCREHQHALRHYRLITYVNYDFFHRSDYFFVSFSHSNEFFRIIVSRWKGR